jgi:hypothetical protein
MDADTVEWRRCYGCLSWEDGKCRSHPEAPIDTCDDYSERWLEPGEWEVNE